MTLHGRRTRKNLLFLCLSIPFIFCAEALFAQPGKKLSPEKLKKLSLDELLNLNVTSVSKSPEKLTEVASAIQVITNEDIRRSTATRLPEALRLAPNLQVAQSNSHDWGISARGFNGAPLSNNTLADKLLVMIDGRSVYTPLFGGVFWDAQNVVLEDIDRIEVVSGPGGTLWGANAVNGVINVITKNARETQGLYVSGIAGSLLQDHGGIRYGGQLDTNLFFRVFGQRFDQKNTKQRDGSDAKDGWDLTDGGFRMDYFPSARSALTVQGGIYGGEADLDSVKINGQNLLGRWSQAFSRGSNLTVQVYFDRTWRDLNRSDFTDELSTYDLDLQHQFAPGARHTILWGAGYRVMDDAVHNTPTLTFTPARRTLQLFNGFIQDRIALIENRLELTLGTKLLHNDYSGFEIQPSARIAWTPNPEHTVWAAVSRAVRTPSRFDADETTPALTTKNGQFDSEKVVAYELGYRMRPLENLSFSLATFYNAYDDLRSINVNDMPPPGYLFANDLQATTWGFEISGNLVATPSWRLRGGYTFLDKRFTKKRDRVVTGSDLLEAIDPNNQVLLQSILDLPGNFQFDLTGRYIDVLPAAGALTPAVPAYITFNARLAWIFRRFEFSVAGQNLAEKTHGEFGSRLIPRSFYLKVALRF